MKKIIIALLTMAVVLAGTAAIVNASGGSEREVAKSSAAPQKSHLSGAPAHAAVNCRTIKCINKKLTKLNTGVFKCERVVPVTQYSDYAAVGGGAITALDLTQTGDQPTAFVVVDVCQ
jgi:hypothetical protein